LDNPRLNPCRLFLTRKKFKPIDENNEKSLSIPKDKKN
jgi:hypothetical protein